MGIIAVSIVGRDPSLLDDGVSSVEPAGSEKGGPPDDDGAGEKGRVPVERLPYPLDRRYRDEDGFAKLIPVLLKALACCIA